MQGKGNIQYFKKKQIHDNTKKGKQTIKEKMMIMKKVKQTIMQEKRKQTIKEKTKKEIYNNEKSREVDNNSKKGNT